MSRPIERITSLLAGCRRSGSGWSARCPAHDDSSASLALREDADGKVLLHCFAGCPVDRIAEALGLATRDLFPDAIRRSPRTPRRRISLKELAEAKAIPLEFLQSLGLRDVERGVMIPYSGLEGDPVPRQRLRTALRAGDGSRWLPGDGLVVPYGLDRLADARSAGYLVLVEGESDCWTCWYHGFPALGLPGASMAKALQARHLEGISRLHLLHEPDGGGDAFVAGVLSRLGQLGWVGDVLDVRLDGVKDPNALHRQAPPGFAESFRAALDGGEPVALPCEAAAAGSDEGDWLEGVLLDSGISLLNAEAQSAQIEAGLRQLASRASTLDALQRQLLREAAVRRLEGCGLRASARAFDAALRTASRLDDGPSLQGRELTIAPPEPSPEAVDGAQLLDELTAILKRHVVLPDGAAEAQALWLVHSYALDAAFVSPILALTSPEKRCGKTTNLEVLAALAACPLPASNITPAALFRTIEAYAPTLLVDEADTFLTGSDELRGVINSGHTKASARVVRTVGDTYEPRIFSTWCPKVIALIGRLPGTLDDRSIVVSLKRRGAGEPVEKLRRDRLAERLAPVRSRIARWAKDSLPALREANPEVPAELHDRAQDNWRPLLAIADLAGEDWPQRARQAALALAAGSASNDESARTQLLSDIQSLFTERDTPFLPSEDVVLHLVGLEERPWAEWGKGKPLSKCQLAKLLRPFGIRPRVQRVRSETPRGYVAADFEDAFARYLPLEPQQAQQSRNDAASDGLSNRNIGGPVAVRDSGEKPRHSGDVADVAVASIPAVDEDNNASDADPGAADVTFPETAHGLGLTESVSPTTVPAGYRSSRDDRSALPPRQCRSCHGSTFWAHADGRQICARCHPPIDPLGAPDFPNDGDTGGSQ